MDVLVRGADRASLGTPVSIDAASIRTLTLERFGTIGVEYDLPDKVP